MSAGIRRPEMDRTTSMLIISTAHLGTASTSNAGEEWPEVDLDGVVKTFDIFEPEGSVTISDKGGI